jgi:hypothetical protein
MVLSGSQTNFSSVQRRLWLAKASVGCNTHRRNPRHRSYELVPVGPNAQAQRLRVGLLLLALVATEDDRLIANKGPPGLPWPSAWWWQLARHSGLDPRRTPEKVFTGHPCDRSRTSLEPWDVHRASGHATDMPKT